MTDQTGRLDPGRQVVAFFRRVATSDFRLERPTDWERGRLEKQGIVNPLAQTYAAWRSSLLYLAAACVLFGAIWSLATIDLIAGSELLENPQLKQAFRVEGDPGVIDGFQITSAVFVLIGALTVCVAAPLWPRVRLSRLLARIGWLVMFLAPLVLYVIPIASMVEIQSRAQDPITTAMAEVSNMIFRLGIAGFVLAKVGPRWLALMPGIIRSSMTLKTLLPEARGPGWTAVLLAPLFSMLLLILLAVINQLQGSALLILGMICLMLSPLVFVVRARALVRPCRPEDVAAAVVWPRRIAFAIAALGFLLLLIWGFMTLSAGDVIAFAISTIGSVLLMMVVGADFILPLLRSSQESTKQFVASPLCDALDQRCDQLADVLETRVPFGEALAAPPTVTARLVEDKPATGRVEARRVESVQAKAVPNEPNEPET
ncbi:MAG: hypothetical protein ACLFUJ_01720 [Phycisphaerae bacterium]